MAGAGRQQISETDGATVLVVDDDPDLRHVLRSFLTHDGYQVLEAGSGPQARKHLHDVDAVLLDVMMPEESGLDVLGDVRKQLPHLSVVMVTASHDVTDAVRAMKMGAFDYLLKPVRRAELVEVVRGAVGTTRLRKPAAGTSPSQGPVVEGGALFYSAAMHQVMDTLLQVAASSVPVMLLGESGTGKEVMARFLHGKGNRKERPFVAVNCAALPRELVESELFGHEHGAFTGTAGRRRGVFEEAQDGTLFLDEVGELEAPMQAKLLRVLQEREFTRVGGTGAQPFRARVVVATNRDLAADVAAGRFRPDLYYRLDVISVTLPPLRDRREEIPALARHLLARFAKEEQIAEPVLAEDAVLELQGHSWPGNVRELENVLKRAALMHAGEITAGSLSLPKDMTPPPAEPNGKPAGPNSEPVKRLSEHQAEIMMRALKETRGNVAEAARRLGIGRATFYRRAKRWGLPI